jgi:hypothetical protein
MRLHRICLVSVAAFTGCHSAGRERAGTRDGGDINSTVGSSESCSSAGQPPKGACLFAGVEGGPPLTCIEFTGSEFTTGLVTQVCATAGMRFVAKGCPTASLVGRCINHCGERNQAVNYLYVGTAAAARKSCYANTPAGQFLP